MSGERVTIGVPVYNAAPYIAECIDSIKRQTYTNWHCLIIDDGSTDGSLDVIRALVDDRFTVVASGDNRGLIFRLNQIAQLATTTWIFRMDADDVMHPDRLQTQMDYVARHPHVNIVSTAMFITDVTLTVKGVKRNQPPARETFNTTLFHNVVLNHATCCYRKEWILRHPYATGFERAEDMELFIRAVQFGEAGVLPEALYFYRNEGNVTHRKYFQTYITELKIIRRYGLPRLGLAGTARILLRWAARFVAINAIFLLRRDSVFLSQKYTLTPADAEAAAQALHRLRTPA